MHSTRYRQCDLRKKTTTGELRQVSYIPEQYASQGKFLKLKGDDGEWTDGWKVVSAGELNNDPPDYHNAIKGHRKNTGDSMRKGT